MSDDVEVTLGVVKWLTALVASVCIWAATLEQRVRNLVQRKANKEDVAKDPVEAETITVALNDVNASLKSVRIGQDRNAKELVALGKNVATLMERTKD